METSDWGWGGELSPRTSHLNSLDFFPSNWAPTYSFPGVWTSKAGLKNLQDIPFCYRTKTCWRPTFNLPAPMGSRHRAVVPPTPPKAYRQVEKNERMSPLKAALDWSQQGPADLAEPRRFSKLVFPFLKHPRGWMLVSTLSIIPAPPPQHCGRCFQAWDPAFLGESLDHHLGKTTHLVVGEYGH